MNAQQALARLYKLALFSPGVGGATFANVLLRAERALAGTSLSDERSLPTELAALRDNLTQRQAELQVIHDAIAKPSPRCGHSACSQHYIETGRTECIEADKL